MTNPPLPTHRNQQREPLVSGVPPARYKLLSPASLPITRAPIAVTTQQSPTALLESPVLLTQVKAESSPTTGTFFMPISPRSNPSSFAESPIATRSLVETSILKCSNRSCMGSSKRDGASVSLNPEEQQQLKQSKRQENPSPHDLTLSISPSSMPEMQLQSESRKSKEVAAMESSSDDGYSWRKYGEKPVNGSELHRSYHECMHPSCQVKKQLECSQDGRITDVIQKGSHDHAKPQLGYNPSEAKKILSFREEERAKSQANKDDPEVMAAASNLNGQNDERRREDSGAIDDPPAAKAVREPRVVVQTLSEIDVLDDGYRWRKYGQKVVKGNPNPRSYYKCTNVGCGVRKHVERASHDPKAVITTYEGKHNHDVPTQRNANNDASPLMATSNGNDQLGQVAGFLGALPLQYHHQPGGGEIVSLDLEVGLSPRFNGRDNGSMLHPPPRTQITNFSIHMGGSNHNIPVLRATTVNPAVFCEGSYVPREARGGNLAFDAVPSNHSCSSYRERFGRLLAGP